MYRIGLGYDIHTLTTGRDLIIGGVKITHEKGLMGHSDADVLVHALMDAMLGAAGLGDIGRHFPDTDNQYKGIDSMLLLKQVTQLLHENRFYVNNLDVTVVAQRPKLAGFIPQMEANIAAVLGIDISCVNVKATTTEKLGFEGEGLGISAYAVCTIAENK